MRPASMGAREQYFRELRVATFIVSNLYFHEECALWFSLPKLPPVRMSLSILPGFREGTVNYGRISRYRSLLGSSFSIFTLLAERADL